MINNKIIKDIYKTLKVSKKLDIALTVSTLFNPGLFSPPGPFTKTLVVYIINIIINKHLSFIN